MFPNSFLMQELVRRYFDENLDREDEGKEVETLFIFTLPKATPIPSHLILINDYISKFSLQPSRGMLLKCCTLICPSEAIRSVLIFSRFEPIIGRVLQ
ncbi:hypothetical protein J3458_021474 [Metarhizium acridum]|uniref:uncharacterized protein n=1 Tax=Metarhizium acridum TaxID=92637 RepID=UPI001C6AE2AD|nr:hypothetical protein J3458_021474 [Metarhizium acridum]